MQGAQGDDESREAEGFEDFNGKSRGGRIDSIEIPIARGGGYHEIESNKQQSRRRGANGSSALKRIRHRGVP